jgi:hypothetical protein
LFTSFKDRRPMLFGMDLTTGNETRIASKMGVNGRVLYPTGVALLARGKAEHGLYGRSGAGSSRRLTTHWGIDVGGSWSPGRRRIAFAQPARGRRRSHHVARRQGSAAHHVRGRCFSPAWSPTWAPRSPEGARSVPHLAGGPGCGAAADVPGSNEDPTGSDARYIAFSGRRDKEDIHDGSAGPMGETIDGWSGNDSPIWSRR